MKKDRPILPLTGRAPRRDLASFVRELPAPSSVMGLTHVTTGYVLREILDTGKIGSLQNCPIFSEPLVYTFYGRSAFRSSNDQSPTDLSFLFPVVLILDPKSVPRPKYVFGFDSGAFVRGYLDDYLDPYMPLLDFHLDPDVESAAKLVAKFFGTTEAFFQNEPKVDLSVPVSQFEATSMHKLLVAGGRGANKLDDRVSTPEIIFDTELSLDGAVRAAILPDGLASDDMIGGRLRRQGIRVDGYPWNGASRPSEYHMMIRRMVRSLYEDFGWGT